MAVRRGEGGFDPDLASLAPRTPSDTDYAEIRPIHLAAKGFRRTVLTFESYRPEEIVAIARHIAGNEKIAIAEAVWPLLQAETLAVAFAANRFRYVPVLGGVTAKAVDSA